MILARLTVRKQWMIPWEKIKTCSNSLRRVIAQFGKQRLTACYQLFVLGLIVVFSGSRFLKLESSVWLDYSEVENENDIGTCLRDQLNIEKKNNDGYEQGSQNMNNRFYTSGSIVVKSIRWSFNVPGEMHRRYFDDRSGIIASKGLTKLYEYQDSGNILFQSVRQGKVGKKVSNNQGSSKGLIQSLPQAKGRSAVELGSYVFCQWFDNRSTEGLKMESVVIEVSESNEKRSVVLKEKLEGWKGGQRKNASLDGLEKFLFLLLVLFLSASSFMKYTQADRLKFKRYEIQQLVTLLYGITKLMNKQHNELKDRLVYLAMANNDSTTNNAYQSHVQGHRFHICVSRLILFIV